MCTHVRQNFWKVSSNSKHHSKPTMNINSQHHNLLGNQISPKSQNFCIWRPFCTLVTMATTANLNLLTPPPKKLPHTTVDIPKKWIIIWLPNYEYQFPTSKSTWKQNFAEIGGFCILVAILDSNWPPQQTNDRYQFATSSSTWKPNFAQIGGFLYLAAILYLGYHGKGHHFEFFSTPKSCHTLRWIFLQSLMKFDERNPKFC